MYENRTVYCVFRKAAIPNMDDFARRTHFRRSNLTDMRPRRRKKTLLAESYLELLFLKSEKDFVSCFFLHYVFVMVLPKSRDKLFFMTQERTLPEKKNFFQRITTPHPSIEDHAERRFASALATLLLALLPLYFLPEGIRALIEKHPWVNITYFAIGIVILGSAYLLARSPYPRWGAAFTMLYFTFVPFASLVVQAERYAGENAKNALIWSIPIMLMALILLHPKDVKWIVFLQVGLYLLIPALWDGLSYAQVLSTLWLVLAVGGLMMVSAFVQSNYLYTAEAEATQSKTSEARYKELFDNSPVALWEIDLSLAKKTLDLFPGGVQPEKVEKYFPPLLKLVAQIPLTDANSAAIELFEAEDSEEMRKNWLSILSDENSLYEIAKKMLYLWQGVAFPALEVTVTTFKGKHTEVILNLSLGGEHEDDWEKVIISGVDITERKGAERRLADMFRNSPVALWEADFSELKAHMDDLTEKHGNDLKTYIQENPKSMQGSAGRTRLLDANHEAVKLYEADDVPTLLASLRMAVGFEAMLALRDGVIALWEGKSNYPIETIHRTLTGKEKKVVVRFTVRPGYEETWEYVNISVDDVTERKKAEKEILRQREFLQTVIDGIDSPFYVLNVDDYSIALANAKARELGIDSSNFCYALTHRRDRPCDGLDHPCPLKHVVAKKEPYTVEHIHYRADGSPYYADVHGYPIYDEKGNVVQMIEYSIDITARKDAENELRKLSSATEQAASGIVITNIEGVIEFANPAAAKITGYPPEELIGQAPNLLKSGKHEASFYDELWDTIIKGEIWRGELINRRKDGSLYWESQVISPVRDENNEITHYVAIKEDITKIKEAEEGLRNLSNATEQTANGVVITDLHGHIQYVNPAFSIITGYTQEEVVGKTLEIQRSGEHDLHFYNQLDETVARGEIWKGEIINRRKDGSLYWESQVISPVKNDAGEITHHVLVKEDITRRKELEQALALAHEEALVASDMKTQLLANVSHDMRTPLGAILGYTEMLDAGVFTPLNAEQAEATRAIASSSQRLLDFVNNLLSQAQIETGKIILNATPFKPEKILDSLGSEISLARTQGLNVATKIDENLPEIILCDPYWLGQILHNLLSNAIKFTPAGGEINIDLLRMDEKKWALRVADTGKGIPLEAQEYIFESFRQVDASLTRETHTGSGLGLSIVNHLVRLMNGEIELESEVGKGSIFTIHLPLEYEKEKEA